MDLTHVPYKGGGPASIAVISGENAVMFGGTSAVQHINSGKLKALAVTGKRGWATLPNVPGIDEVYPGYSVLLWHGIFAPKGTPQAVLDKLRTEINAVLAMPKVKEQLIKSGAGEPYITTPQQFADLMRSDYDELRQGHQGARLQGGLGDPFDRRGLRAVLAFAGDGRSRRSPLLLHARDLGGRLPLLQLGVDVAVKSAGVPPSGS